MTSSEDRRRVTGVLTGDLWERHRGRLLFISDEIKDFTGDEKSKRRSRAPVSRRSAPKRPRLNLENKEHVNSL